MLQCPLCGVIPATCLTQDGLPQFLIDDGWYKCTAHNNVLVQPVELDDDMAHQPAKSVQEE